MEEPDYEWLMMDASYIKVHSHAAGARGGNQTMSRTKGGSTRNCIWVDVHGMPLRALVTEGTTADCSQAGTLIEGVDAGALLADRAYDTNEILVYCHRQGIEPVIPAKRNRKEPREYDCHLYRIRHRVENAFLHLKRWRGIATRYAKNTASFMAAIYIRCLALWSQTL